jgi:GntR family transcriptional regulator, rspAB operon transcriptional repressor
VSVPARSARRTADAVFNHLHGEIVSGALPPGSRVDLDEVGRLLDVSRTPVREALLRLEAEGFVERTPYRGAVVAGIDPVVAEHTAAARIHLEGLAVRLAVPRLTAEQISAMSACLKELENLQRDPNSETADWNELNRQFHGIIYEASNSPTLIRPIDALAAQASRFRLHFRPQSFDSRKDHRALLAACKGGDPDEAARVAQLHILRAYLSSMGISSVDAGSPLGVALTLAGIDPHDA